MLTDLASENWEARASTSGSGDDLDQIMAGLNRLADVLAARRVSEIETARRFEEVGNVISAMAALDLQPHYRTIALPQTHRVGEPVMLTECGGISYAPRPGEPWFGYGTVTDTEGFLAKYAELIDAILDCPTIAGFCYTQLTDTEQETNGLLTAERAPKLDPAAVQKITARPSKAIPGEILSSIQATAEVTNFQGPGG